MSFEYTAVESREVTETPTVTNARGEMYVREPWTWVITICRVSWESSARLGDKYVVRVARKGRPDEFSEKVPYSTLRAARTAAGRTATVYRNTMDDYDWKAGN